MNNAVYQVVYNGFTFLFVFFSAFKHQHYSNALHAILPMRVCHVLNSLSHARWETFEGITYWLALLTQREDECKIDDAKNSIFSYFPLFNDVYLYYVTKLFPNKKTHLLINWFGNFYTYFMPGNGLIAIMWLTKVFHITPTSTSSNSIKINKRSTVQPISVSMKNVTLYILRQKTKLFVFAFTFAKPKNKHTLKNWIMLLHIQSPLLLFYFADRSTNCTNSVHTVWTLC